MSEFSGYEKMPSSVKKLGLSASDFSTLEKLKWVVTEKVHGANFSFIYERGTLKFAKRKAYLSWKDDFFGFQLLVSRIEDDVIRLFEALSSQIPGKKYTLYGELFGGKYPHPAVAPEPHLQAIQTGVYYAPGIHFCAFDIAIEPQEDGSKYYLDYETAIAYLKKYQVFYAHPLLIGKYTEALNFDTRINSRIPKQLALPELSSNVIEGVVIKPYERLGLDSIPSRPIFKLKNKEFEEEKKFHQAEKWTYIPEVSSKSEDLSFILDEIRNFITYNRLESAISKIGALDFSNTPRMDEIASEFFKDVLLDFKEHNPNLLEELAEAEKTWIQERVKSEVQQVIRASKKK